MFLTCVTGRLLTAPTLLEDEVAAQAAMGVVRTPPEVNPPDIVELGLLCQRFLVPRLMRFNPGDEITVDGEVVWRNLRHQDGRVTRLVVEVTRILSTESREMMALNLDDPVVFEAWRERNKIRTND